MENPQEQQQNVLLARVIKNVEKLSDGIAEVSVQLEQINRDNVELELLAQMWENYQRNTRMYLKAADNLKPPIPHVDSSEQEK
jgi:DASH complex subunit DAD4